MKCTCDSTYYILVIFYTCYIRRFVRRGIQTWTTVRELLLVPLIISQICTLPPRQTVSVCKQMIRYLHLIVIYLIKCIFS